MDTIFLIDPDAKSWTGHYMAYNEKLSAQLGAQGVAVKVLCRKDLSREILAARPNYVPYLSTHSWEVANRKENREFLKKFESEILAALARVYDPNESEALLYMYCGSLEHARILVRIQERYPWLRLNVNLFYLSFQIGPGYLAEWRYFIDWLEEVGHLGDKLTVTLPTAELRDALAASTGRTFPVAPHPSTGVSDAAYREIRLRGETRRSGYGLQVLFPSSPRLDKGYLLSVGCVSLLGGNPGISTVIRHSPTFSTQHGLDKPLENLPPNARVIEGELTDEEFLALFAESDVVVLPYTSDAFAMRTSGLLIDAMYHRLPAVVVEGTWLANLVRRYDAGVVVDRANAESLAAAVRKIGNHLEHYQQRMEIAAADYFARNSWQAFGQFLLNPANALSRDALAPIAGNDGIFYPKPVYTPSRAAQRRIMNWLEPFPDQGRLRSPRPDWVGEISSLDSRTIRYSHSIVGSGFSELGGDRWCYEHSTEDAANTFTVVYDLPPPMPRGLLGGVFLAADCKVLLHIGLGRFGKEEPYEGVDKTVMLEPGTGHLFLLETEFSRHFPSVKLSVEIRELHGTNRAELSIGHFFLQDKNTWAFRPAGALPSVPFPPPGLLRDPPALWNPIIRYACVITGPEYKALQANRWRFVKPVAGVQSLWVVLFEVVSPHAMGFIGGLRIQADRKIQLKVSLGRFGNEPYEGVGKQVLLEPGNAQHLVLEKVFSRQFFAVKLQVEVTGMEDQSTVELTIDGIFLEEIPLDPKLPQDHPNLFPPPVRLAPEIIEEQRPIDGAFEARRAKLPGFLLDSLPLDIPRIGFSQVIPGEFFKPLQGNLWRYEKPLNDIKGMWIAVFDVAGEQPMSLIAGLRLKPSRAMKVSVSLGRFGKEAYEGTAQTMALSADTAQTILLEKAFSRHYPAVKLQLEVLDASGGESLELTIDRVFLNESESGILRRVGDLDPDVARSDQWFREGDYAAALCCYLRLAQAQPSPFYPAAALRAARRMGWGDADTLEAIRSRLAA